MVENSKGSSGRTRTYNPPVNRLMQVIYPVGSSCFSVGLDSWFSAYSAKNCSVIVRSSAQFDLGTRGRVPFRRPDFADFQSRVCRLNSVRITLNNLIRSLRLGPRLSCKARLQPYRSADISAKTNRTPR